jgi:hypothetical protein
MSDDSKSSGVAAPENKPEAREKSGKKIVTWWSRTSPKHTILLPQRDANGNEVRNEAGTVLTRAVKFERSRLDLDESKPAEKQISEDLKASGRYNVDLFIIGDKNPDQKSKIEFHKRLLELASDESGYGTDRLVGMFTMKELRVAGINPNNPESSALVVLALETKSMGNLL